MRIQAEHVAKVLAAVDANEPIAPPSGRWDLQSTWTVISVLHLLTNMAKQEGRPLTQFRMVGRPWLLMHAEAIAAQLSETAEELSGI